MSLTLRKTIDINISIKQEYKVAFSVSIKFDTVPDQKGTQPERSIPIWPITERRIFYGYQNTITKKVNTSEKCCISNLLYVYRYIIKNHHLI